MTTSEHGVEKGNVRIPLLADDWPVGHYVNRDFDPVGVNDGWQIGLAEKIAATIDETLNPLGIDATAQASMCV